MVEIPEEDVILAEVPKTGSIGGLLVAAAAVSGVGLTVIGRKKDNE